MESVSLTRSHIISLFIFTGNMRMIKQNRKEAITFEETVPEMQQYCDVSEPTVTTRGDYLGQF